MKLSNSKLVSLTIGVLVGIWCLAIFIIAGHFEPALQYSGGITCGLVAGALSILYLMVYRNSPGSQAVEVGAISVYVTNCYVIAAMVSNTVFVLTGNGGFNKFLLLWNVVIIAVYIIVILYVEKDAQRLSDQLDRTEQMLSNSIDISGKLGAILGIVEDNEVRNRILKLKEAVDYSTNITTASTLESEKKMECQLDELMSLLINRGDLSAVKDKIREAEITWKIRGSAGSSRR
ncbi:MAG: hypothetical protein HFG78_02595 [Hungatella sp.]|nr:hypothetical protein [Hungatella sp.]